MTSWLSHGARHLIRALALATSSFAGEHVLVIGDSLSKDYEVEFPSFYPNNPAAWGARNWAEILHTIRNLRFDLGTFAGFPDLRGTSHEFNVSVAGVTARLYRNFLRQDSEAEQEVRAMANGNLLWAQFPAWRQTFDGLLARSATAVIFLGGNDLSLGNSDPLTNVDIGGNKVPVVYQTIYEGGPGAAGEPDRMRISLRESTRSVIEYLRIDRNFSGPIVICSVPHVGATPRTQNAVGTDPLKTKRVTDMLDVLRDETRALADEFNCAFADVYELTMEVLSAEPVTIGGVIFRKEADPDARTRFLFSGDGYHGNTAAQAIISKRVVDALREKYPTTHSNLRLSNAEIITDVLGLNFDTGFIEWLTDEGVPPSQQFPNLDPDRDGVPNVFEYLLDGRDPMVADGSSTLDVAAEQMGDQRIAAMTYRPRFEDNAFASICPQFSNDLFTWIEVPESSISTNNDGSVTARVPVNAGESMFLRLLAR
jgi:lysophospholipase L1-like esterase